MQRRYQPKANKGIIPSRIPPKPPRKPLKFLCIFPLYEDGDGKGWQLQHCIGGLCSYIDWTNPKKAQKWLNEHYSTNQEAEALVRAFHKFPPCNEFIGSYEQIQDKAPTDASLLVFTPIS